MNSGQTDTLAEVRVMLDVLRVMEDKDLLALTRQGQRNLIKLLSDVETVLIGGAA